MAIETWRAAEPVRPRRQPTPVELTPHQKDLVILRLDPHRAIDGGLRYLSSLVGKKWPGSGGDDHRPQGWGWEQVEAYRRVFQRLQQQEKQHSIPSAVGRGDSGD